ncbi:hypothetical protein HanRHA438_Chr04g0185181 [Helianthus annuus]|nr:hypothetical protein HanRHA438_Chr04g0185181 [Helianthus annuus]
MHIIFHFTRGLNIFQKRTVGFHFTRRLFICHILILNRLRRRPIVSYLSSVYLFRDFPLLHLHFIIRRGRTRGNR